MAITITHAKTNAIADWTQPQLDAIIAGNPAPLPPVGTTLAEITLPSDWNADHIIEGLDDEYARLDGTNQPFTGAITAPQITASPTGNNTGITANGSGSGIGVDITHNGSGVKLNIGSAGSGDAIRFDTDKFVVADSGAISSSLFTASRALATNASKEIVTSTTTDTELGYLSGVTAPIQQQLARLTTFTYFV